jgi:hypothetical protein
MKKRSNVQSIADHFHLLQKTNETDVNTNPGEIFLQDSQPITINADRDSISITITNESNELISIGSHFHLIEANRHLSFDRNLAYGMRLVTMLQLCTA